MFLRDSSLPERLTPQEDKGEDTYLKFSGNRPGLGCALGWSWWDFGNSIVTVTQMSSGLAPQNLCLSPKLRMLE